jgi:hypothetical protein
LDELAAPPVTGEQPKEMNFIGAILIIVACLSIVALIFYLWLKHDVQKEIATAPRIPMYMCDIHGAFPKKSAIRITVPSEKGPPMEHDMCVFCYSEKMEKAKSALKL